MADAICLLVEYGHREEAIPEYTVEKFRLYLRSALRREASKRIANVIDTGVSISGAFSKGKLLEKHLKMLTEATENGDS